MKNGWRITAVGCGAACVEEKLMKEAIKRNKAHQATMRSEDPLTMIGNCTFLFRRTDMKSKVIINTMN